METFSRGGVPVYSDYRENIVVDPSHPILAWKANKERFSPMLFPLHVRALYPEGLPRIGSRHSEDALSWNLFRSLQLAGKLPLVTDFIALGSDFDIVYFWARDSGQWSDKVDPDIQECLNKMEPWGKDGTKQQTETDIILRGKHHLIMVECKLGKPGETVRAWCRSRPGMRSQYKDFVKELDVDLFSVSFDFEKDGNRLYQLFRNYLLGAALSLKWGIDFSLLAIVNSLNTNLEGRNHAEEFGCFQSLLRDPSNVFLITWQIIWNRLRYEAGLDALQDWLLNYPLLKLQR
jgi:hypothetical protein